MNGAVAYRTAVMPRILDLEAEVRGDEYRRAAFLASGLAATLLVIALFRLELQAKLMPDSMMGSRMETLMMRTRWGGAWMVYAAGAALALVGFVIARLRPAFGWTLAAVGAVTLAFGAALSGHAGASPQWMAFAVAIDAAHIIGASGWLGSLLYVIAAGVPAMRNRDNSALSISKLVNAFSPAALAFAALVVVSGAMSAWMRLGGVEPLWSSHYGRVLLLKLFALSAVIATGAYNWKRVKPSLGVDAATHRLVRSARAELAIGVVVLSITAVLVATPPPSGGP